MKYHTMKIFNVSVIFMMMVYSSSLTATHYTNKTGRTIHIINVSEQRRQMKQEKVAKKRTWWNWNVRKYKTASQQHELVPEIVPQKNYKIIIENGQEADLDNQQDDEITITSPGMSDKRKLFPTNNAFNYVVTFNKYNKKFEQFDINHAE